MKFSNSENGFMVLVIVMIAGAIATAAATTLLLLSALNAQTALSSEQSFVAQAMASTCVETALEAIYNNVSFSGTATVTIGSNVCSYTVALGTGQARTVTTTTTLNGIKRRVQVDVNQITPVITYSGWKEY